MRLDVPSLMLGVVLGLLMPWSVLWGVWAVYRHIVRRSFRRRRCPGTKSY